MQALIQYGAFLLILTLLVKPLGGYMARVFLGQRTLLDPVLRPVERLLYRVAAVDERQEMDWKQYAVSFVLFSFCGTLLLYGILRLQHFLPCWGIERLGIRTVGALLSRIGDEVDAPGQGDRCR